MCWGKKSISHTVSFRFSPLFKNGVTEGGTGWGLGIVRDYARALGGEVSGEHGIGHAKRGFLHESLGETQVRLMQGIKAAFDPKGILNPGKVVG